MTRTTYDSLELRLKRRARDDERTVEETIERLLDETVVEVDLETVIEIAMDQFDDNPSVTVGHLPTHKNPTSLDIVLYTGEASSWEESVQLFSPNHRITISRGDETVLAHFSIRAVFDGPVTWDTTEQTTIYMPENVHGVDPVELEDGLAYLRDKLEKPDQWSQDFRVHLDRIRSYSDNLTR